jgi:hypothetical protein
MIASKLRCVRILGFLLLNAPNQDVRIEVTKSILSCEDGSELVDLGSFFERYVILPCELVLCLPLTHIPSCPVTRYEVRTPISSEHSSRSSFGAVKSQMKVDIRQAPKNHKDTKDRVSKRAQLRSLSCSH